jgi:FtsP/CotA-like multicopper oxidase with cupredoxin domain
MHPHGVFYRKDSEGALYDDGTSGTDKEDDAVPPGKTHLYTWEVPERTGPGPNDPSSIVWLYHSHTNELKDVDSGLIGALIITRRGMADADGKPKDVDREFVCLYLLFDENVSWYLDHNIQTFTSDPKGVKKLEFAPVDNEGNFSGVGSGFTVANAKFAINGYIYGTGPMMTMKKGDRVRWYLVALGEQFSVHTPHWHGNVVLHDGKRTDVVPLMQAQMETVDMVPDNPGIWMFHCHIDDHMDAGMVTLYKVEP